MKKYIMIVAGGKGLRMNNPIPKQFHLINGRPVLMHTFDAFTRVSKEFQFILVLPSGQIPRWKELCRDHEFRIPHEVAEGGPARFHSVKSGLQLLPQEEVLVAVHDGVRPLVSKNVIEKVFIEANMHGNAIPCIPLGDSLRKRSGVVSQQLRREDYVLVQTPQCFRSDLLKKAYRQTFREEFTDDASVLENDGAQIRLVEGSVTNIKITAPHDLLIAGSMLPQKDPE